MNHSQMLTTRRRKASRRKDEARLLKRAKKLDRDAAKKAGANPVRTPG